MLVIIKNRFLKGFLLIKVMIALVVLGSLAGVVAYYCGHISYCQSDAHLYCKAVSVTQRIIEEKISHLNCHEQIDNMLSTDHTYPVQLSVLPLNHSYHLTHVTTTWYCSRGIQHSYSLIGGRSEVQ